MGDKIEVVCCINKKIIIADSSFMKRLFCSDWVAVLTFSNTETPLSSVWWLGA